jgi:hypothetical protein
MIQYIKYYLFSVYLELNLVGNLFHIVWEGDIKMGSAERYNYRLQRSTTINKWKIFQIVEIGVQARFNFLFRRINWNLSLM